jgi:hypothetical protein
MRAAGVACVLVLSAPSSGAGADPPGASRRLEAVQLGLVHELAYEGAGNAPMLSIEAGKLYAPGVGVAALLRSGAYENGRIDILVGPRIYYAAVPDQLLLALGAGVLLSLGDVVYYGPQGQPFVEAYVGVLGLRSRCNDLEVGVFGGFALDQDLRWIGLAVGMRRRAW